MSASAEQLFPSNAQIVIFQGAALLISVAPSVPQPPLTSCSVAGNPLGGQPLPPWAQTRRERDLLSGILKLGCLLSSTWELSFRWFPSRFLLVLTWQVFLPSCWKQSLFFPCFSRLRSRDPSLWLCSVSLHLCRFFCSSLEITLGWNGKRLGSKNPSFCCWQWGPWILNEGIYQGMF